METASVPLGEPSGPSAGESSQFGEVVFLTIRAFSKQGYDPLALTLLSGFLGPDINSVTDAKEQKEKGFSKLLEPLEFPSYLVYLDLTTDFKWAVSDEIQSALDRINSTISGIGDKLTEQLNRWHLLLSKLPSEDPNVMLRLVNGFFQLLTEEPSEPEREMIAFLREYARDPN